MILLLIERYASRFHSSLVIACFLAVILDVVLAVICPISASLSIPEAKPPNPLKAVFPRLLLVLVEAATAALIKIKEIVQPDKEIVAAYEKKYQIFRKLYPSLKEVFAKF